MNYYIINGAVVSLKDNKIGKTEKGWVSINNCHRIPEDGMLDGKEVHAGDIVITTYNDECFIIVDKDSAFADAITADIEDREKYLANGQVPGECESCSPA